MIPKENVKRFQLSERTKQRNFEDIKRRFNTIVPQKSRKDTAKAWVYGVIVVIIVVATISGYLKYNP